MERCVACDEALVLEQPYVAVMKADEAEALGYGPTETDPLLAGPSPAPADAVAVPFCILCHRDPSRRIHAIKAHFFTRNDRFVGVDMAFTYDDGQAGLFG